MVRTKGFTLIELLIVIAVVAILATTVILVLNPVNILREARDSQRIADLGQLSSALSLYLTTAASPTLGSTTLCYVHIAGLAANCAGRHATTRATNVDADRTVDSTGYIPVNFGATSGGSPLAVLPIDPVESVTLFYSYATNATDTYELNANMESARYANTGGDDVESRDGGNNADIYEVGNAAGLNL